MCPVSVGVSNSTLALEKGEAKLWILLVGVNKYQDKRLPSLRYSALDCQGLGEALAEATQKFPRKSVMIHHDDSTILPLLENVRASLQQIAAAAKQQDTVLFYFSGHGVLEPKSQQVVLCLADTQKSDLLGTGLGLQELLRLLGNSSARQQLVWLDACHSGGMTLLGARSETELEPLPNPTPQLMKVLRQRAAQSKGFYALLSCDQTQQSWEFPQLGHGVFTYYLMRGLRGEAADSQGVISADGIYRYVYYQTLQYIDNTNQQLRLINQQKTGRGEIQLHPEYPQQTPKRIVEGVGELILGLKPNRGVSPRHPRQVLVVEGLTGSLGGLNLGKVLISAGGFEVGYWPRSGNATDLDVREAIQKCLLSASASRTDSTGAKTATVFLYLRGRIEKTEEGEAWLVLGDGVRLNCSWLRKQLHRKGMAQQIVVLDCPGASSLAEWVEDLQGGPDLGQCLLAAAAPEQQPERFAQALLKTLNAEDPLVGLTVAEWITKLQVELAGTGITLLPWLSGIQGVIEVLPSRIGSQEIETTQGIDLGLCPYMGLKAFEEKDAQFFYGRETLTQKLINAVNHRSFLAVVGASGSGKSSLVQAGLITQLRIGRQLPGSEQWWLGSFSPGKEPLSALSWRLVDSGTQRERAYQQQQIEGMLYQGVEAFVHWLRTRPYPMVVLIVDQFEELFTMASAEDRQRFLDIVLGAVEYAGDRFKLAIALRSDFINSCLEVAVLYNAIEQSHVLVPSYLTQDDYHQVIVEPAQKVGLLVEPELIEVLLQELNQSAADLPLLEFVLEQLWSCRRTGYLTLQTYQQLGGIKGALERKAQEVYNNLLPEEQECAKWIFLSLTRLGDGCEDTRRRILKSELKVQKYPASLVERTLQVLTSAKLVVMNLESGQSTVGQSRGAATAEPEPDELVLERMKQEVTVEVAHEILIRHWSTLRWWLEENRARLQQQRQIAQAAQEWKQSGQQSDFLLRGVRLAKAEEIYIKYSQELPLDVQQFIKACLEERNKEAQERESQRQRELWQERKALKAAQTRNKVVTIFGVVLSVVAIFAFYQWYYAQKITINALAETSKASLLSNKQLEALVTAVQLGKQLQNPILFQDAAANQTVSAALQRAVSNVQERNRLEGHGGEVTSVVFSPDGKTLASGSLDNTVKLWDAATGKVINTLNGHSDVVTSVVFSPDGKTLASGSLDNTIKLWNVATGKVKTLNGHSDRVMSVVFSPDGKTLASGSLDNTIKLWNVATGKVKTLNGHSYGVTSVVFSPDGKILASGSLGKTVKLWNVATGTVINTLSGHSDRVTSVVFSPDGKTLASGSLDNSVKLWNVATGTVINTLDEHSAGVSRVVFSPDGKTLASGSLDNSVKLWNVTTGKVKTLNGHSNGVSSVVFSPDGKTLASGSFDNSIKLWDVAIGKVNTLNGHSNWVSSIVFSPDGKTLASGSLDNTVKLWDVATGTVKTLNGHSYGVSSVVFSPDGKTLASGSLDNTVKLWDVATGKEIDTLNGHSDRVSSVVFSPDGKSLASGSLDNTVKFWNVATGKEIKTLNGHSYGVSSVVFSPDGKSLASGSLDNTVRLWDVATSKVINTLNEHSDGVSRVVFSPDGKSLASGSLDKTVKLWDVATGKVKTLNRHSNGVMSVVFSPDGKTLASGSLDKTVKLWDVATGKVKTLNGHSNGVSSVVFSPDGKTLASGSLDNSVELWNLYPSNLNDLMTRSCDWLRAYLQTNPNVSDRTLCDGIGTHK